LRAEGVSYDAGTVMGFNWRPHYNPGEVKRELQIVGEGLHCTAVRISGEDFDRLTLASR